MPRPVLSKSPTNGSEQSNSLLPGPRLVQQRSPTEGRPLSASLHHLVNYVPMFVLDHIRTLDTKADLQHVRFDKEASAMCIDIVGFTKLTEQLSEEGSAEGAENISAVLNTYFDRVLHVMEGFGADVVQFSGDAIMALFHKQPGLEQNTILCYKCAQAITFDVGTAKVSLFGREVEVSLKTAIASGNCVLMITGGHRSRWMPMVGGDAWNDAALGCNYCEAGHLFVHPSAKGTLRGRGVIRKEDYGSLSQVKCGSQSRGLLLGPPFADVTRPPVGKRRGELSDETVAMLRCFLFKGVIRQQRTDVRNVVSIFVKFCGIDSPSEKESPHLRTVAHGLMKLSHRHEGVLNKFIFDDKGLVALLFFGVPMFVHPNDSERSCQLAADAVELLEPHVGRLCIGIARDKVYCGSLGNEFRAEYTVLGDSVNLASRLMSFGFSEWGQESCVVVDGQVYSDVRDEFGFSDVRHVQVKGKNEPVLACTISLLERKGSGIISPRTASSAGSSANAPSSSAPSQAAASPQRSRGSIASSNSSKGHSSNRSMHSLRGPGRKVKTQASTTDLWAMQGSHLLTAEQLRERLGKESEPMEQPEVMFGRADAKRKVSSFLESFSQTRNRFSSIASSRSPRPDRRTPSTRPSGGDALLGQTDRAHSGGEDDLSRSLTDTLDGERLLRITGSKGIGRSMLLRSIHKVECPKANTPSVMVRCEQSERQIGLSVVMQLLLRIMQEHVEGSVWLTDAVGTYDRSGSLGEALDRFLPELVKEDVDFNAAVRGAAATIAPPPTSSPLKVSLRRGSFRPRGDAAVALSSLRDILVAAVVQHGKSARPGARRAVVVLVDDVQWIDPPSLGLLFEVHEQLSAGMEAVTLGLILTQLTSLESLLADDMQDTASVGSCDSEDNTATLASLFKATPHVHVAMEGLSEDDAKDHYKHHLNADSIDVALTELLLRYSDGNPYVAEQIMNSLLSHEYIGYSSEGEALLVKKDINVGDIMSGISAIEAMTLKTLDALGEQLDASLVTAMKVVSVVGKWCDLQVLKLALTEFQIDADAAVHQLEKKRVMAVVRAPGERPKFSFKSSTLGIVQYNNIMPSERKELHLKVATAMQRMMLAADSADDLPFDAVAIGGHFHLGDMPNSAVRWFAQALPTAIRKEDWLLAKNLLDKCVRLWSGKLELMSRQRRRSKAEQDHAPHPHAVHHPPELSRAGSYEVSPETVTEWNDLLIDLDALLGDWAAAIPILERTLGFTGPFVAQAAAQAEIRRRTNFWAVHCACCATRREDIHSSDRTSYRAACDAAVLSNRWEMYAVAAPCLAAHVRGRSKHALNTLWWLGCAQVQAVQKKTPSGLANARKEWLHAWRPAGPQSEPDEAPAGALSALVSAFAFPSSDTFDSIFIDQPAALPPAANGIAAARVSLAATAFGLVEVILRGDRDRAVSMLHSLVHRSRATRAKGQFLNCVMQGRVVKLVFVMPETAPRVVTSSDDLIAMLSEPDWASSADFSLEAFATALIAAEPTCAPQAPALRRRQSRMGGPARGGEPPTRDPIALLYRASECLQSRGSVHLTPLLIPALLVMTDTALWALTRRDGVTDARVVEKVLPTLEEHLRTSSIIFPRHTQGLHALIEAICSCVSAEEMKPLDSRRCEQLTNHAEAARKAGLHLIEQRLLLGLSRLSSTEVPQVEKMQEKYHLVALG
eukprot:TRINITY_DN10188_c1_g7_i1.p1 TRINITY_DN10188_c1_g7~~TRINITY_DN10188_c1_g7_i1.p1  ORF type:complete len:1683 (+),score=530.18 TRINITY_DN10188_c1_g7_i1:105-5153(+)